MAQEEDISTGIPNLVPGREALTRIEEVLVPTILPGVDQGGPRKDGHCAGVKVEGVVWILVLAGELKKWVIPTPNLH